MEEEKEKATTGSQPTTLEENDNEIVVGFDRIVYNLRFFEYRS